MSEENFQQQEPKYKQPGSQALEGFSADFPQVYDRSGKPVSVPSNQIPELYSKGVIGFANESKIPMFNKIGEPVYVSPKEFGLAIDSGFSLDKPEDQRDRFLEEKFSQPSEVVKTVAQGLLSGATAGLAKPVAITLGADKDSWDAREEVNPVVSGISETAGIVGPLLATGGTSLAAETAGQSALKATGKAIAEYSPVSLASKAGKAAESAVSKIVGEGAEKFIPRAFQKMAPKIAGSALEASLFETGKLASEELLGDADLNSETLMARLGPAALFGGAIGGGVGFIEAGAPMVSSAFKKARESVFNGSKKVLSSHFGLPESAIDDLIKDHEAIKASGGKEFIDEARIKIAEILDQAAEAKDTAKSLRSSWEGLKKETFEEMGLDAARSKEAAEQAKELLGKHIATQENAMKEALFSDVAPKIVSDIQNIKQSTLDLQTVALDSLENQAIKTKGILQKIDELANNTRSGTVESMKAADEIQGIGNWIKTNFKDEMPGLEAKKLIKALDDESSWKNAGPGLPRYNSAMRQLRFTVDDVLKDQVPSYREIMEPIKDNINLSKSLSQFDTVDKARSALEKINADDLMQRSRLESLKKLSKDSGSDYSEALERWANREKEFADHDLGKVLTNEKNKYKELTSKLKRKEVLDELKKDPTFIEMTKSETEASQRIAAKEGLDGITAQNLEKIVRDAVMKKDPIALKKLYALEAAMNEPGLSTQLKNSYLKTITDKSYHHGSRNVVLNSLLGHAIGGVLGGVIGGITGALLDKIGPRVGGFLIDKYIKLAAMEKMGIDWSKQAASKITNFLGAPTLMDAGRKYSVPLYINFKDEPVIEKDKEPLKKKVSSITPEDWEKISDSIAQVAVNPTQMMDHLSENLKEIGEVAPKIKESLVNKALVANEFLYKKLPKNPLAQYSINKIKPWRPSDHEISKFSRYHEAVMNPISVLDDLNSGTVSKQQVEALKEVYPKVYQSFAEYIVNSIQEHNVDLPYKKRVNLGMMFDVPTEAALDPKFMITLQGNQTPEAQASLKQEIGQDMSLSGVGKINAGKYQTRTEQVINRS